MLCLDQCGVVVWALGEEGHGDHGDLVASIVSIVSIVFRIDAGGGNAN